MKIRNIDVDFDFFDADDVERFEKEAEKVKNECKTREKENLSTPEIIRQECKIINDFFDIVFGKGISEKIFGNKNNLMDHIKAFEDIIQEKIKQQKGIQDVYDRYQPNREQRRYNQYKGKRK